jgi:hypothetical protein
MILSTYRHPGRMRRPSMLWAGATDHQEFRRKILSGGEIEVLPLSDVDVQQTNHTEGSVDAT